MGTATIEVQEIPVVVDTLVLKGDTILVFNGVVVGSREGRQLPGTAAATKARKSPRPTVSKSSEITHDLVSDALFRMGAATVMQLSDHLHLPRGDENARAKVGRIVRSLTMAKVVEPVPTARKTQHIYTLANINGKTHAP